jgi:hypothetical protein
MLDLAQYDFHLDLFHGQLHRSRADIYARLSGNFDAATAWNDGWRLGGHLEGPRAENTRTLPARVRLQDAGAGESLLACALLPDPCSWGPGLPLLYDVHVQLLVDGSPVWEACQALGLRQLGVVEGRLQLENQPWSLMGAHQGRLAELQLPPPGQVLVLEGIQLPLMEQCSDQGGWVLTVLDGSASDTALAAMLRDCARWAANWCVVVRDIDPGRQVPTDVAPNLLIGQWFAAGEEIEPAGWADIALVEMEDPSQFSESTDGCPVPVVAVQKGVGRGDWDDARAACQQLHHQLAAFRQFAGYIIV